MAANGEHTQSLTQKDLAFTDSVIAATGPKANPRLRKVITSLIHHLHGFAREVSLTTDEFLVGIDFINEAGRMSDDRRNEGLLLGDVLGLESLMDEITTRQASSHNAAQTPSAILGPMHRTNAPLRDFGAPIMVDPPKDGQIAYMHGVVRDTQTGFPIVGAIVDVWQSSTNGLYEQQDPDQVDFNLRGRFSTTEEGRYALKCLRPVPYPIPHDGPAGTLLKLLDRHHFRPAHIHVIVTAPGYQGITTQIFDRTTPYLDNDSVFAVKDGLTVDFVPSKIDSTASVELEFNIALLPVALGS